MRTSSKVAREAIEKFSEFEDRVAYILRELPHLKRQSAVRALRRALDKEGETVDTGADSDRDAFEFDEEHYCFTLAGQTPFYVPADEVQSWVRWYVTDGAGVTQRTVTRMSWQINDRPLTKDYARRIFKCLGIDKNSPPFAPHMLLKHTLEELEKLHFSAAQADVETRIRAAEPKEWRANWLKAETKVRELEARLTDYAAQAEELAGRINRMAPEEVKAVRQPANDNVLLVPVYDVHVGKQCVNGINASEAAIEANAALFAQTSASHHGRIVLVFGGDFFHIDSQFGTSGGTPQEIDGRWVDVIHEGWEVAERIIELWRKTGALLDVFVVPGNHDRGACHHLAAGLSRIYRNVKTVNVHISKREMQAYVFGKVLLVFEHGDGPKSKDLTKVIANRFPEMWGATTIRVVVTGHLHHLFEHDDGILILQQPSPSGLDGWHDKKGFSYSVRAMRAYTFSKSRGHLATWVCNLDA